MARFLDQPRAAWTCAAAAIIFAGVGTAVSWPVARYEWWVDLPLHTFGSAAAVVGALVWARTPLHRVGQLIVVMGAAFHLGDLRASTDPLLFATGFCLGYIWMPVLAHLALAWPTGRLIGRSSRILVVLAYLSAIVTQTVRYVVDAPRPPLGYDLGGETTPAAQLGSLLAILLGSLVTAVIVRRWVVASPAHRRRSAPLWACVVVGSALFLSLSVASLLGASAARTQFTLMVCTLLFALFFVPAVYLAQLVRAASAQVQLASIALHLDRGIGVHIRRAQLQQVLADVLGDPDLTVTYHRADDTGVEVQGRVPPPRGRVQTPVYQGERPLCVIGHDEALDQQPGVARAAAAAAALAIERMELYEQMQHQVEQLRDSRQRLAEAALDERQRIQQDLHDNAQQQLYAVLAQLSIARLEMGPGGEAAAETQATLGRAHTQLRDAIDGLRQLIQAIYPAVLTEQGLAAAVDEAADAAPIPIHTQVPRRRWPAALEHTAYFIIAEALGNVYKHARAEQVTIILRDDNDRLIVEVVDDGIGITTSPGPPALRSLRDRVSAAGGRLRVERVTGRGTRIAAELPKEAS